MVDADPSQSSSSPPSDGDEESTPASQDPITALRAELASIEGRPVAERVARFEHANAVLAAALAELDEV